MLENTAFTYDGISSRDMKVVAVKVDSGLFEESFLPSRSIREESIRGRHKPYFLGYDLSPFEFPLVLYFEDLTKEEIRRISRWLLVDFFKPLIFESNPERIFYCMYEGNVDEFHNGLRQGYLTLNMRCDSPFSYSPVYSSEVFDFSTNVPEGTNIEFENYGDGICKPLITLEKIGEGDIRIVNLSDSGRELKLTDILTGDLLTINCEDEQIDTEVAGVFHYENHNNVYLRFVRGINRIKVYGNCKLQFKYQFTIYQG